MRRSGGAHTDPGLTGLIRLEQLLRFMPDGLAVVLEFKVTRLLPIWRAHLEEVPPFQQEVEVPVTLHAC